MNEPLTLIAVMGCAIAGLALVGAAALRAWTQWLELKHLELRGGGAPRPGRGPEMGELRERVRRLEAIAGGEG